MGSSMTSRSSRKRERRRARPPSQKARADPSNVCVQFSGLPTPERIEECAGIVRRLGSTVCEPGYDVEVTHLVLPEVTKAAYLPPGTHLHAYPAAVLECPVFTDRHVCVVWEAHTNRI